MPASTSATPSRIATWPSWPHACITPTVSPRNCAVALDLNGTSVCSVTGSASMSARSPTVRPGFAPRSNPTTPVTPTAGFHFHTERAQALCNVFRGAHFAVAELGMRMEVAPPFDRLRLDRLRGRIDLGARDPGGRGLGPALDRQRNRNRRQQESASSGMHTGNLRVTRGRYGRNQGRYAPYRTALVQSCRVGVQGEQARALGE